MGLPPDLSSWHLGSTCVSLCCGLVLVCIQIPPPTYTAKYLVANNHYSGCWGFGCLCNFFVQLVPPPHRVLPPHLSSWHLGSTCVSLCCGLVLVCIQVPPPTYTAKYLVVNIPALGIRKKSAIVVEIEKP